jgi:BarA-like signal transduction histidine kinase
MAAASLVLPVWQNDPIAVQLADAFAALPGGHADGVLLGEEPVEHLALRPAAQNDAVELGWGEGTDPDDSSVR